MPAGPSESGPRPGILLDPFCAGVLSSPEEKHTAGSSQTNRIKTGEYLPYKRIFAPFLQTRLKNIHFLETVNKAYSKVIDFVCHLQFPTWPLIVSAFFFISLKNLGIERFWVEGNARVNYPIKNALRHMEQRGIIDMELEDTKFYVSSVTLRVARVGMRRTVQAWNHHPIQGMYRASHPARTL